MLSPLAWNVASVKLRSRMPGLSFQETSIYRGSKSIAENDYEL
jgi:hypothetical protein